MRLTKFFILFFFILINYSLEARFKSYTEVPVLIHLNINQQNDSNGFNLVKDLPSLFYKEIIEGRLILWDSPKKEIAISGNALKGIEQNNKLSFSQVENLFINELWTSSRRKTEFVIIGFSFLSQNEKGKVSFGFIDAREAFNLLYNNYIQTNSNGSASLNFINALYSRKYDYSLIQFGSIDFSKNISLSLRIKEQAFNKKKKIANLYVIPQTKKLTYLLEKNLQNPNDPSILIMNTFETFLNQNKEIFFDIGGSKYYDYHTFKSEISITRVEIVEVWEKKGNQINYIPKSVKLYANNKELNSISIEQIESWQLLFKFKSLRDLLIEKQYLFSLLKCNNELIAPTESNLYIKALKEYKWTQVSNYVKYSRTN